MVSHMPWGCMSVLCRTLAERRKLYKEIELGVSKCRFDSDFVKNAYATYDVYIFILTQIRFWNVTPRIVMGWKSVCMGLLFGCGSTAVPAGGSWLGVKKGTLAAGLLMMCDISLERPARHQLVALSFVRICS